MLLSTMHQEPVGMESSSYLQGTMYLILDVFDDVAFNS